MRLRSKVIVLVVAGVLYLGVAALSLLAAMTGLIVGGAFCDNCTQDDIDRIQHPMHVVVVVLAVTLVAGISFGWWWLTRPQKPR
jgi:uncharacterized membrane protein AbrB (regulator of aidB expression)